MPTYVNHFRKKHVKGGAIVNPIGHFRTITRHRHLVMGYCFRLGLYRQGLCHDLSKYSPVEFLRGCKYYQGYRSPNDAERRDKGYSAAWLHHKGRNKHHYEYWIDYSVRDIEGGMAPAPMPVKYIAEMLMDRIAACKVYNGENYTDAAPWEYYSLGREKAPIHPKTKELLERLLCMLANEGENKTFAYIRREILNNKK